MITRLRLWTLGIAALTVVPLLAACAGGEGTVAGGGGGISGTGVKTITTGKITGFGSVIVNGIEFTPSARAGLSDNRIRFEFDNISTSREDGLRLGMIVTVRGSVNDATGKGEYEAIEFEPDLRGPLDDGTVDAAGSTFRALGRSVRVGAATIFDGINDLTELQALQGQRPDLEVSGNLDETGLLHATRVALVSAGSSTGAVELKGAITSVTPAGFTIGTITVIAANARLDNLSLADLKQGLLVEVKGVLSGSTISGERIEAVAPVEAAAAGEEVRLKGVARSTVSGGTFSMAGPNGPVTVQVNDRTGFFRGNLPLDNGIITVGTEVEIEGTLVAGGALEARSVSVESERSVKLEGNLLVRATDLNPGAATITLNGVTVRTVAATRFEDNRKSAPQPVLTLADLADGDHLQIAGFTDTTGAVIASQLQRFDPSRTTFIQGPVGRVTGNEMTILGITVRATTGTRLSKGTTIFPDFASFALQITPDVTIVKARGTYTPPSLLGPAEELEIQP